MAIERIQYGDRNQFTGTLVYDETTDTPRPLLLVSPNWLGVTGAIIERTQMLAGSRFVGFVADMYGGGKIASGPEEAAGLANALRADSKERRLRINAALSALVRESDRRAIGDASRKAAVGFCFGGGNVLELARSGADLQAVACLHGDLNTDTPAKPGQIKAPVLILHGSLDPISPKRQRDEIETEFDAAKVNWQMLTFGGLVHSFSESQANVPGVAQYNAAAARQALALVDAFIENAFAGTL